MNKHHVALRPEDRLRLKKLVRWGVSSAAKLTYARVLLLSDEGPDGPHWTDSRIVEALGAPQTTVRRVRRRFGIRGMDSLNHDRSKRSLIG